MACVSVVAMLLWLPYYPVRSIIVMALDVIVIWAVTTWHPSHTDRRHLRPLHSLRGTNRDHAAHTSRGR
jgi:hypothetical protein